MPFPSQNSVDVVVQMYGKPLMTATAISSLLKKSGQWINKIYLIEERKQPFNADSKFIAKHFKDKVIRYRPWFYNGLAAAKVSLFGFPAYRRAVRYQYAFEKSDRKYLYVMHNDMLFHEDILGMYLSEMQSGNFAGVGPIGMCWNCPASYAGLCTPETYTEYRPTETELAEISAHYPAPRKEVYDYFRGGREPWPLPECRLNEWSALIDLEQTLPYQYPYYKDVMFGQMDMDVAVRWFHQMNNKGLTFKNLPLHHYATHVWTGKEGEVNSGVSTSANMDLYTRAETMSYEKLVTEFGFSEAEIAHFKPGK